MLKNKPFLLLTAFTAVLAISPEAMAQNRNATACDGKLVSYLNWKETPAMQHLTTR